MPWKWDQRPPAGNAGTVRGMILCSPVIGGSSTRLHKALLDHVGHAKDEAQHEQLIEAWAAWRCRGSARSVA
jgi:hypothetical protein